MTVQVAPHCSSVLAKPLSRWRFAFFLTPGLRKRVETMEYENLPKIEAPILHYTMEPNPEFQETYTWLISVH